MNAPDIAPDLPYEYHERLAICLDSGVPLHRAHQIALDQVQPQAILPLKP